MGRNEKLAELASNAWWSWNRDALELLRDLNPRAFVAGGNSPGSALRCASPAILNGPDFNARLDAVYGRFQSYMQTSGLRSTTAPVAYLCMEFGIHESMPMYSGGLGILAGDHVKAASDLGLPFTAVGLLVKDGYLLQRFDTDGWQQNLHPSLSIEDSPIEQVFKDSGEPLIITVEIAGETVDVAAWRLHVGRSTLYYLDTDVESNTEANRTLTRRLYGGGRDVRIKQEMILGIGAIRLLRALGTRFDVVHLNEGHCAFATLELLRELLENGVSQEEAIALVREQTVFTTHTPVAAGHDTFDSGLFCETVDGFSQRLGMTPEELARHGRQDPDNPDDSFNMTILGLRMARSSNGVSRLNGEVARAQWQETFGMATPDEVPIGHVTNGVHLPTWTAQPARQFIEQYCGPMDERRCNSQYWLPILEASDAAFWELRTKLRRRFIDFATARVARGSLGLVADLDPEALTIGFARRMAPYKRAVLIFSDLERAARLFSDDARPLQLVFAGKAHPHNEVGKSLIQQIVEIARLEPFKGKVVFLEDYDIEVGQMLVSGCDVWLNNPRRPMEASGTSGQKIAAHGGLNLSVLDGWWPEGYDGTNGWAIGARSDSEILSAELQDPSDAADLYSTLENEVIPTFYNRDPDGLPREWVDRMRRAMSELPGRFSATRMLNDYADQIYDARTVAESTL